MSRVLCVVALLVALVPARVDAWGSEAHRFIMDRAIALLPPELRPLFEKHRATLVERSIDPDTWRIAGFESEPPNHFLDIDWEGYGKYPFSGLPRDYAAAVAKFGRERIEQNGTLPWRTEEYFGNLRRAFEAYGRRGPYGRIDILLFSASLSHYVSDGHQPFHAVLNYDGQLTGQHGIHARFESVLFERYRGRLTIAPVAMRPVTSPRDFMFDTLVAGAQLVPAILKADLDSIGSRDVYDERYYEAFLAANRAVVERRMSDSVAATAAIIAGAWEAAGKPPAPVDPPQPVQRRRRP